MVSIVDIKHNLLSLIYKNLVKRNDKNQGQLLRVDAAGQIKSPECLEWHDLKLSHFYAIFTIREHHHRVQRGRVSQ